MFVYTHHRTRNVFESTRHIFYIVNGIPRILSTSQTIGCSFPELHGSGSKCRAFAAGPENLWSIRALVGDIFGSKTRAAAAADSPRTPIKMRSVEAFKVKGVIFEAGFLTAKDNTAEDDGLFNLDHEPTEKPRSSWFDMMHPTQEAAPTKPLPDAGLEATLGSVMSIYQQRKAANQSVETSTHILSSLEGPGPGSQSSSASQGPASQKWTGGSASVTLKMPGQAAKDASANNLEIRDKYAARLKAKMMKAAMRGGDAGGGRGELDASGARVPTHNTKPGAGSLLKYLEQRGLHQAVAMLPGSDPLPELQRAVEFQFKHQLHHEAVLDGEGEVGEAEQWTTQLHELMALWKVEPRTVMVATKSTTLLEAAIAAGCLTVEHVTSAEKRKQRLSAVKADYVVKEVLGVKEKVEEINGVSMRLSTSLTPPPERIAGHFHRS